MNTISNSTALSDEELITRITHGEKQLYELIVRRYNPYLYKVGRSYNYNHEDTEDLMQESFVDAYKNLAKFEKRSCFKTWLVKIMLHNCYRKHEKSSYKHEFANEISDNSTPMFTKPNNHTDQLTQSNELRSIIENALSEIPLEYRMVFSLREINALSTKETAELLGITESNVKVRLNRSKEMLRQQISKSYHPRDLYDFHLKYCDGIVKRVMHEIDNL